MGDFRCVNTDLQQLNCNTSISLITYGHDHHSPAISLTWADCQLTLWMLFLLSISAMHYIQVVLALLDYIAGIINGGFHHLAQVQCSSSGTEDCVAALSNPFKSHSPWWKGGGPKIYLTTVNPTMAKIPGSIEVFPETIDFVWCISDGKSRKLSIFFIRPRL